MPCHWYFPGWQEHRLHHLDQRMSAALGARNASLQEYCLCLRYRRLSGRRCYLSRGSQKMLSRPRLTERAISAEAHRTCYLSRGSQNVLSRSGLTEDAISAETHRTCYLRCVFFFFKFCSGSPACALIKPLFLQNWYIKIVKNITCNSLTMILTIYYTSSGGRKNVPSQLSA